MRIALRNSGVVRVLLALVAAGAALAAVQPQNPPAPQLATPAPATTQTPEQKYDQRLAALTPANPRAYFELAEDVMDESRRPEARALARRLLVLAVDLSRSVPGPARPGPDADRLGASCCLALAELATVERERRWFVATANLLDPAGAAGEWSRAEERAMSRHTAYLAAAAVGLVRSGEGLQARQALSDPEVAGALSRYQRLLSDVGAGGGLTTLSREADAWPCRECGNQRVVRKTVKGVVEYKLCGTCNGNPGPVLARSELLAQLRLESWLLSGIHRSWSAHVLADLDQPLKDPAPSELAPTLGVDTAKPYWRGGAWSANP